ncbi:CMGC family protein kinase [Trichomonas vaginalis G3]|uniref:non-specific serine/threonine protein kinase n=1 Tax=Trichomonas vaginalis (strain ATCC PRA-98 / G3) TaxID=412133 RepID=A2DK73_TRIV3|nr:STKc GSK3 domain-containing protein [Trichomonas vaginalis G3]EAY19244.1 CMGC family protein kinase [Trichomonas vaginalis G3]KAI5548537.1 STKc GSK3 domain-containing protein [Trichomonas vaginalis G3]|eukprot:XP_001580230.1 CMGC family protein kinase [Trichomonas vaginalis G3]
MAKVMDKDRLSNIRMHSSLALSTNRKSSTRLSQQRPPSNRQQMEYRPIKVIGQGAFGIVYCARAVDGSIVAIKKVLLDPRYKNRELETMQEINNRYCIRLCSAFKTPGRKPKEYYLNLVMDYLPLSLHQFNMNYRKERKYPPLLYVKLFAFQMFAGLNYIHSIGVTHRDLKPQNILCDMESGELKICDFGSAKQLVPGEKSVSYIASRYYRAPELIFDCVYYTSAIDIWAGACVVAEMLMAGMPIFAGGSSLGQLHEIVKVLGPPTEDDMNSFQHGADIPLSSNPGIGLENVLPRHTPPDIMDLLKSIFIYNPSKRPTALECIKHPCFDELFDPELKMPSGRPFPFLDRSGQSIE